VKAFAVSGLIALLAQPVSAQIYPTPGTESPRVQTVQWATGGPIVLTALPETTLTVMLEPGEMIRRATLAGSQSWTVEISAETDSFQVAPPSDALPSTLMVATDRREYTFRLETGRGLMAAYLVRLTFDDGPEDSTANTVPKVETLTRTYRLRGDRAVRPISVRDNGAKTVIAYAPDQALPAVFAIGPTGDEEVVNGYMRGEVFVVDRVYEELIFRIDKDKARAQRRREESAR
jgi:type IV secretion system protein VirB9